MKNVLISTTRQWNPGDEFIMMGAINVLKKIYPEGINPIIFNRNPSIRVGCSWRNKTQTYSFTLKWDRKYWKGKSYLTELFRIGHYDNSWKDDMNAKNIDLALFAGSPEWYGKRLKSMYYAISNENIQTIFLGLGAGDSVDFSESGQIVDRVLTNAKFIATRDKQTEELLKKYNAIYMPCPALFASPKSRIVKKVKKIGLIFATNDTLKGNNVSKKMHDYIINLYKELSEIYDVELICHYIDEIDKAIEEIPNIPINYSYDSKDYIDIYNKFDLVIGGRVHGIGMSASLGIPGIMIKHDARSSTTDGFLASSISIGTETKDVIKLIDRKSKNIEYESKRIIDHKEETMKQYDRILNDKLELWG